MDNPCKGCDKATEEYADSCEYWCDNPCQRAKDFYKSVNKKLDELLSKLKRLKGE